MANYHPTSVRLIPRLRQELRREARNERRSVAGQIAHILIEYYQRKGIDVVRAQPQKEAESD